MGFGDIFFGIVTGGAYNAAKAAAGGYSNQSSNTSHRHARHDNAKAMAIALEHMSDNDKITNLAQVHAGVFQLQQADVDREMQNAANLEQGLEALDTKLQVGKLDYIQQMTAEENRHIETIAEAGNNLTKLQDTSSLSSDILPPPSETFTY
ncbi:MAG TPA: hypothetical protein VFW62_11880 [bacterium]|nr:hypothetical protein [bacterium]